MVRLNDFPFVVPYIILNQGTTWPYKFIHSTTNVALDMHISSPKKAVLHRKNKLERDKYML
jgi:hypothetical protein